MGSLSLGCPGAEPRSAFPELRFVQLPRSWLLALLSQGGPGSCAAPGVKEPGRGKRRGAWPLRLVLGLRFLLGGEKRSESYSQCRNGHRITCHLGRNLGQAASGLDLSFTRTWAPACASGWGRWGPFPKLNPLCSAQGLPSCIAGTGNWRHPTGLTAAGLEGNGGATGLLPSAAFPKHCHSSGRLLCCPGGGPAPPVVVWRVKELEVQGSRSTFEGLEPRRALPVPHGKTPAGVCVRVSQIHPRTIPGCLCWDPPPAGTEHGWRVPSLSTPLCWAVSQGGKADGAQKVPLGVSASPWSAWCSGVEKELLGIFSVQVCAGLEWKFRITVSVQ